MDRVLAQVKKELTQLRRDKLTLALALVLPVVLLLLLSSATSLTVKGIPVAVQDLDNTPLSRRYIEAVQGIRLYRADTSKLFKALFHSRFPLYLKTRHRKAPSIRTWHERR
jgi:hypothetical protein